MCLENRVLFVSLNQNLVAIFEHCAVFFFFKKTKAEKTKTLCPVYVLNSDTRVHLNCIILFPALTPPSAAASAAVAGCRMSVAVHRPLKLSAVTQDPRNPPPPHSYGTCDIFTLDIEWR